MAQHKIYYLMWQVATHITSANIEYVGQFTRWVQVGGECVRVEMRQNQCKNIETIKWEQRSVASANGAKRGIKDDVRIMLLKFIICRLRPKLTDEDPAKTYTGLLFLWFLTQWRRW